MDIQTALTQEFYENYPRWEAKLSNGIIVYSDNEYINNLSDWDRLQKYCKQESTTIIGFCFGFRDHIITLPENKKYYYFRRMVLASFSGIEKYYFVVGCGNEKSIEVSKYAMPEVIFYEKEERDIS